MMSLKNVLLVNGVSSGATGILLVALSRLFANLFQVSSSSVFVAVGIFLIIFAGFVLVVAIGSSNPAQVRLIIALDILWTVMSFLLVAIDRQEISLIGNVLIMAVALWVAAMTFLQTKGLKQVTF